MGLFDAVIDLLSIISTWPDRYSSSGAFQLLGAIKQLEFILAIGYFICWQKYLA